jgi:hypothetical protein
MEFLDLVFRLGVLLAIFSFIWGLIKLALGVLRSGLPLPAPISLALKTIQYFLIVDITVLFCTGRDNTMQDLVLAGFILLMYFAGKMQNLRSRFMIVQVQGRQMGRPAEAPPNMKLELAVVAISMGLFVFLTFRPEFAENGLSTWFLENSLEIERTPIIGFIFKVVGFFFTLTILFRMVSSLMMILSGQAFRGNDKDDRRPRNDDHFDDYEEMS